MTVKELVKAYLKTNGFDGLFCTFGDGCGCSLENLMPCGAAGIEGVNRDILGPVIAGSMIGIYRRRSKRSE